MRRNKVPGSRTEKDMEQGRASCTGRQSKERTGEEQAEKERQK